MACLRTSDATYDNCSIKIWKTRESALKTPQNRRKKMTQKIARVNDLVQSFVSPMRRGKKTAIAQWQKRNSFTKDGGSKYYSWLEFTGRKFRIPLAVLDLVRIPVNKVRKKEV